MFRFPSFGVRSPSDEGLAAEIAELRGEQARLSQEVERTLVFYDERTRALAKRIAFLERAASESAARFFSRAERRSAEQIRSEQEDLWRTVRRLQASLRMTRELETELREWVARVEECRGTPTACPTAVPTACPGTGLRSREVAMPDIRSSDHPATRIEIIASELRLRGRDPFAAIQALRARKFEGSAGDVDPLEECRGTPAACPEESLESVALADEQAVPEWRSEDHEHIVREIFDAAREVRRMRAHESASELAGEIAQSLAGYRRCHGYLRLADRIQGIRRENRVGIGEIVS